MREEEADREGEFSIGKMLLVVGAGELGAGAGAGSGAAAGCTR